MNRLTLCMIVRDEEDMVLNCLESARNVVDEIVVADTGSTDGTAALCRSYGADVLPFPWEGNFSAARNFTLEQATGNWILVLDADDEIDAADCDRIRPLMDDGQADAYLFVTKNLVGPADNPSVLSYAQLRLFRNRPDFRYEGAIHERIPTLSGAGRIAPVRVTHHGYLDPVVDRKKKVERNRSILEQEILQSPEDPSLHYYLGVELLRGGHPREALPHFEQAESLMSKHPSDCWLPELPAKQAFCLWRLGLTAVALRVLKRALKQTPEYTDLRLMMGSIWMEQRERDRARAAYRACLRQGEAPAWLPSQTGSGTHLPLFFLGMMELDEQRPDSAAHFFRRCLKENPDYRPAAAQLFLCHWLHSGYETAARQIQELLQDRVHSEWAQPLVRLNESLQTKTLRPELLSPDSMPALLQALSILADHGHLDAASLILQLPSRISEEARQHPGAFGTLAKYWLHAVQALEDAAE